MTIRSAIVALIAAAAVLVTTATAAVAAPTVTAANGAKKAPHKMVFTFTPAAQGEVIDRIWTAQTATVKADGYYDMKNVFYFNWIDGGVMSHTSTKGHWSGTNYVMVSWGTARPEGGSDYVGVTTPTAFTVPAFASFSKAELYQSRRKAAASVQGYVAGNGATVGITCTVKKGTTKIASGTTSVKPRTPDGGKSFTCPLTISESHDGAALKVTVVAKIGKKAFSTKFNDTAM